MIIQVENQQNFNRVQRSVSVQQNKVYQPPPIYTQVINPEASQPKKQPQTIKIETHLMQQNQRVSTGRAQCAQSQSFYRSKVIPIQYITPPIQQLSFQNNNNNQQSIKSKVINNQSNDVKEILSQSIIIFNVEELKQKSQLHVDENKSVLDQIKDLETINQQKSNEIKQQLITEQQNDKNSDPSINELIEKYLPAPQLQISQIREKYKQDKQEPQQKKLQKEDKFILQESNFQSFKSPVIKNIKNIPEVQKIDEKENIKQKIKDEQIEEILQKYQKNIVKKQNENKQPIQVEQRQQYQNSYERKCLSNPPRDFIKNSVQIPSYKEKYLENYQSNFQNCEKLTQTSRNNEFKSPNQQNKVQKLSNTQQVSLDHNNNIQFKLSAPIAIQQLLQNEANYTPLKNKENNVKQYHQGSPFKTQKIKEFISSSSQLFSHSVQKSNTTLVSNEPQTLSLYYDNEQIKQDQQMHFMKQNSQSNINQHQSQSVYLDHEQVRKDQQSQWVQIGSGAQLWVSTSKGEWVRNINGEWIKIEPNFQYKNQQGKIMTKMKDQFWQDENGHLFEKTQKGEWIPQKHQPSNYIKINQKWQEIQNSDDVWMQKNDEIFVQIGKNWINVESGTLLKKDGKTFRRENNGWIQIDSKEESDGLINENSDEDSKVLGELFMDILQIGPIQNINDGEDRNSSSKIENAKVYLHSKDLNKEKLKLRKNLIYDRFDKFFKEILN